MKKVLSALLIVFSIFLLLFFLILFVALTENMNTGTFIFIAVLFLIPGAILLTVGIRMYSSTFKKAAAAPPTPNSSSSSDGMKTINLYNSNSNNASGTKEHVNVINFNFGDQNQYVNGNESKAMNETKETNEPVSVECSGCGSKATVLPNQPVKCEYCGTLVSYKRQ
ncbi:ribosomal protein S27E [Fontibacillus solani]|uniref:Ribosomal protein S27E n=1 Tax=Fontibacillus solani TaxID=1572857 RepID=A0A7W3XTS2_9BACL|nr:hypothetical protein [Fontibacillus solani]MBA9087874.1 ribosomal protein S27E [Fontibacillus solani]